MTIVLRNKKWHLKKDVPRRYASIEPRKVVWVSLHTDSKEKADLQGALVWQEMLAAWDARLEGDTDDAEQRFAAAKRLAAKRGFGRKVAASKGMAGFSRPPLQRSNVKGQSVFIVGSDAIKNSIFNRLSAGKSIRFSGDLEARFFEELVSERRIVRYTRGQPTRAFERIPGRRAECLDAFTYSLAARVLINIDLDRREAELSSVAAPKPEKTVFKSAFLSR